MRNLNLDHLRTLMDVVALASFSAAARRLNLSQPAVSLQIRDLEARLGVRLIDRIGKRAVATAAGRELIEHAQRVFETTDRAVAAMRRHRDGRSGRVHVGTGTTAITYLLPPVLERLRRDHPDIELVFTTGTTHGVVDRMLSDVIDIGLVTLPVDEREFVVEPICDDTLVAIFARNARVPPRAMPATLRSGRSSSNTNEPITAGSAALGCARVATTADP